MSTNGGTPTCQKTVPAAGIRALKTRDWSLVVIVEAIRHATAGHDLSIDEMARLMDVIMQGQAQTDQIAELLRALHAKGETPEEVAGAAAALRRHMTPIRSHHTHLLDTCGTGGDRSGTFNISTAAALVTAAAGVPVAKHGNRAVTSKSGSADVLRVLGVNIEADINTVQQCLDEIGICFCFAPLMHPSMKHVASVRKELGIPTIFNLLGPLCNPASARYQLLGVGRPELRRRLSAAMCLLEPPRLERATKGHADGGSAASRAAVVCGADGLDEVTIRGMTHVTIVQDGQTTETEWSPADFGVRPTSFEPPLADGPEQSAAIIRSVLEGQAGPARDIVVLNAAAALWIARQAATLGQAAELARKAIDDGRAQRLLTRLAQLSHAS